MGVAARVFINNYRELPVVDEEIKRHFEALPPDYWDFVSYGKKYTHNIHSYPAMMIPPISENLLKIIKTYQPNIKNLFDPFAGSGTVLLEGPFSRHECTGIRFKPVGLLD